MRSPAVLGLVAVLAMCSLAEVANAQPANSPEAPKAKKACAELKGLKVPAAKIGLPTKGARITSAVLRSGTGRGVPDADFIPDHCIVDGVIDSVDLKAPPINFEVVIPANWNGKAYQIGGNGSDGFIPLLVNLPRDFQGSPTGGTLPPHSPNLVGRGFATYGGDGGHGGSKPPGPPGAGGGAGTGAADSATWARIDESYRNFGYEHIKKTHDAAMAVFEEMYGMRPRINYFGGESQGGREALQAATRFPADYDGVLAAVPLTYLTGITSSRPMRIKAQLPPSAWLPLSKGPLIGKETMRLCDPMDGVVDGVINNYIACDRMADPKLNPGVYRQLRCPSGKDEGDNCLSDDQLIALDRLHSPVEFGVPFLNGETDFPPFPAGSEDRPGWGEVLRDQPTLEKLPANAANYHLNIRYQDSPSKGDLVRNTPAEIKPILTEISSILDVPVDLEKFIAGGKKLILYSAANDYLTNPNGQYRFYEAAVKKYGQTKVDGAVRFYVTPMAPHSSASVASGSGEPLPRYADLLGTLERWVESRTTPPDALLQTYEAPKPPYAVSYSRPICRYPNYPRYKGAGDPKKAENFACAAP